jgi:hypothetical protein
MKQLIKKLSYAICILLTCVILLCQRTHEKVSNDWILIDSTKIIQIAETDSVTYYRIIPKTPNAR